MSKKPPVDVSQLGDFARDARQALEERDWNNLYANLTALAQILGQPAANLPSWIAEHQEQQGCPSLHPEPVMLAAAILHYGTVPAWLDQDWHDLVKRNTDRCMADVLMFRPGQRMEELSSKGFWLGEGFHDALEEPEAHLFESGDRGARERVWLRGISEALQCLRLLVSDEVARVSTRRKPEDTENPASSWNYRLRLRIAQALRDELAQLLREYHEVSSTPSPESNLLEWAAKEASEAILRGMQAGPDPWMSPASPVK